jgi:hypothetical protein
VYAVIFRADIKYINGRYSATAKRPKELAEFVTITDGIQETSLSYWRSLEHIFSKFHGMMSNCVVRDFNVDKFYAFGYLKNL